MFVNSFAKLSTLRSCSSSYNFINVIRRNATSSVTFKGEYKSPNGNKFKILPLRPQDKEETCDLIAHEFSSREPLNLCLDFKYEEMRKVAKAVSERSLEENVGTIIKDYQGKIVAASLCVDEYNFENKVMDFSQFHEQALQVLDMLQKCQTPPVAAKENEAYLIVLTAVLKDPKTRNQKLARRLRSFLMFEHPITANSKRISTQVTNPIMVTLNKSMNWNLRSIYDAKTYANQNEEHVFKDIDKVTQEQYGCIHPGIHMFDFEPLNNVSKFVLIV